MANPTTNFGWVMPSSTSLVTNLPADFNTFGQGVDTSLQYLLGGTTGQVLSKTSGTNMAFTWITPTDQTPLTTKGDLFTFTTVDARLAVGNNGETLVADSSTSTGLRWQGSYPAGKNMLINGLLDIWQRATTITGQANGYATVDRWYLTSSASCTFAQESTTVPAGCRYSQKVTVGASAASTAAYQAVETSNAVAYAGQNVTFSGRFQSSATPAITLTVEYSTTVDYPLASGSWVAITATSGGSGTAGSSSFTTVSGVYAIPSTAKTLRLSFSSASMASGAILYYGGFQAELGSVVTSLVRNAATIQGELAACMRYYFKSSGGQVATAVATTDVYVSIPNVMRAAPTVVTPTSAVILDRYGVASYTQSSAAVVSSGTYVSANASGVLYTNFTGLTAGIPYVVRSDGGSVILSSEL